MLRSVSRPLDRLLEATPASRDRAVDFLRAVAISVVVVWHWALSVTHRADGRLVMPNPIDDVPLGWLATWLFQVLPVFFIVGGYANLAAWHSVRRSDGGTGQFLRTRLARLLGPTAVFAVVWVLVVVALRLLVPGYRGVLEVALVVFVPLWFLAAYLWVVLLVPMTARAHRRGGVLVVVALGAAVALADLGRFAYGMAALGYVNTALVWVFAHQLGYCWRDGSLRPARRRWALAIGGLCALVVITSLGVYPRSLVALQGQERSHMFPTTAGVAALAVFQTGVATLLAPAISRWLRRRGPWKAVIAINSVILTVFLWHMTALLVALLALERAGLKLGSEPTVAWWLQRPLWLVAPGSVLAVLVAVFARFELPRRRAGAAGSR
jgi:peptidoglycan/LPS O-acetylase OafA/YrhL